ncbi:MAG: glycosyltransferase [Solirubrobacteraceae bacterium]
MRVGLDARLVGPGLGVATLITALAAGLPRLGVDVVWFGEPDGAPGGVSEVVPPPRAVGFPGLDSPLGHRLVARHRVDVMHFAANSGWWTKGPVPHVLTVHDLMWGEWLMGGRRARQIIGHGYLRLAVPRALAGAASVAVPSATTAAALLRRYGTRAEVIANGVGEQWRGPHPVAAGAPYLVAFSGRDPRKGTEISLDLWARVARRGVRLVLLAGAGLPHGMEARLADLAATGQVEVLPYQPAPRLVEIVSGALALLYPSRNEGFGLPVAEAMAAGVPVITGLAPVTLEIGGDAVLGLGADDPAGDGAAHVERLLVQPDLRLALAARGRERAARFTWADAIERYGELYARALRR